MTSIDDRSTTGLIDDQTTDRSYCNRQQSIGIVSRTVGHIFGISSVHMPVLQPNLIIKLLSKPCKTGADNPIKSRPTDTYIAHLCQLSNSLKQLRRD